MKVRDGHILKDARCWSQLKKVGVGARVELPQAQLSATELQAWYRAARKHGMRISIKTTPAGVTVWRIQ